MVNKILLIVLLCAVSMFVAVNALNCKHSNDDATKNQPCNYCYYLNYTQFVNGSSTSSLYEGCASDYRLEIPPGSGAFWTFPTNHCQHFQTNQTNQNYAYFYGNFCNTRDNCTYNDNGDVVCAGFRTSPFLALFFMIAGIFISKFFV